MISSSGVLGKAVPGGGQSDTVSFLMYANDDRFRCSRDYVLSKQFCCRKRRIIQSLYVFIAEAY
jgi:hypothetical protein